MVARLNIKNEATYRAATRLSEMTGQTKTTVIMRAPREAPKRLQPSSVRGDVAGPGVATAGTAPD